jgi:hypothetical protein
MTIKEYLTEYLRKDGHIAGTSIEVYKHATPGKGSVIVEYDTEQERANIVHETRNHRSDFYEAENGKELKDILEFCLGPLVSDNQWGQAEHRDDDLFLDDEDTDEIDY